MRSLVALAAAAALAVVAPARAQECGGWSTHARLGTPRQEVGVAADANLVFAIGGLAGASPSNVVEAYDIGLDAWRTLAPLPMPMHHAHAAAVGGVLYVLGGLDTDSDATAAAFRYDAAADRWTPRAPLPRPRGAGSAAVLDGLIYVVGGIRGGASVRDAAVYDPAADAWTELPPMPTARDHLGAAALGGAIWAVGGRAGGQLFGAVERYDPVTQTWRRLSPMPTPRGGLAVGALEGRLFAFGGEGNGARADGVFPHVETYDPATDAWTRLADMPTPRHGIVAAENGGRLWLPGGATVAGIGTTGVNESFAAGGGGDVRVRVRRTGRRSLSLRGRLPAPGSDPVLVPLRLALVSGSEVLLEHTAPPGALQRRGQRWVLQPPPGSAAPRLVTLSLRPRADGALGLRVRAVLASLHAADLRALRVEVTLGDRSVCAPATAAPAVPRVAGVVQRDRRTSPAGATGRVGHEPVVDAAST